METPSILKHTSMLFMELHINAHLNIPFFEQAELYASFLQHYVLEMGFKPCLWLVAV
jgi:hypothetical protein